MLRISQIKCPINHTKEQLFLALLTKLKCRKEEVLTWQIAKRSLDARKKTELFYSYILLAGCRNEEKLLKKFRGNPDITKDTARTFRFQVTGDIPLKKRPVIVGTGPAGLFCALELAKAGFRPVLLERGKDVERRSADVEAFWDGGALQENSNVQFGEGGAGTFSDGKLNTLVKDKYGRNIHVLKTFVEFGAKESILYDQKPHIGTDALKEIIKKMRLKIIALGGDVRFESRMTDLRFSETEADSMEHTAEKRDLRSIESNNAGTKAEPSSADGKPAEKQRKISAVEINGKEWLETEILVLAIGHSARDTLSMLYEKQLEMEAKPFAVGFRVQHPQDFINRSQYGISDSENAAAILGAAPYKLTAKAKDGRGVYTFCMCPGGYVVNASSEEGHLAVNGMSYSGRDGDCANSAVIVSVTPEDYGAPGFPLSGIAFQRELEKNACEAANGKIPVQKYKDYQAELVKQGVLEKISCSGFLAPFIPAVKGTYEETDITRILPPGLNRAFAEGMAEMDRKIHGFASGETWLCGVESRTSSPVRICRDAVLQSNIAGIYPCGEGAGYAGGITSAAMDGIRVAEAVGALYYPAVMA